MKKQYQLTKEGVEELKNESDALIARRAEIAQNIKTAREFGDLRENTEYHNAMDDHQKTEARILEIEHIMKNAEIIVKPKNITEVELGNTVVLKSEKGSKEFKIVGSYEADPLEHKISNESPIGSALIGKKVGDKVAVGSATYTLKSIT